MERHGLAPSPVAGALLELARRGASGEVDVGGRRLRLRDGSVVSVEPAEGDESLAEFLVHAGHVSDETVRAAQEEASEGEPVGEALVRTGAITRATLDDSTRASWLDRLVAGLRDADKGTPASLDPVEPTAASDRRADLVTLVLDALARLADEDDAGRIGERAALLFSLTESPYRALAARWCDAGDLGEPVTVAQLLTRSPGCARRIAALVRSGLGVLGDSVEEAARRSSLPPPRLPQVQLDPGQAPVPEAPSDLLPRISRLPPFVASIEDPLDAVEHRIRELEDAGASGEQRATAWKELARVWQSHYRSVAEAARAWREAASADPSDREALAQAAVLCAAIGRVDLARAYAEANVRSAPDDARAEALVTLAQLHLRTGRTDAALASLEQALREDDHRVIAHELLALVFRDRGETEAAAEHARLAAEMLLDDDPSRARAALAWASRLTPDDPALPSLWSEALAADGYVDAAVTVLASAARRSPDPDVTRAWRIEAAERAEAGGKPALAAELLLEAFDAEPFLDILYEPLSVDLESAGDSWRRAVVLEEIAAACAPEDRARWLTRAAEAHLGLPGQADHGVDLLTRALAEDPSADEPLRLLRDHTTSASDTALLADSLERVLRMASFTNRDAERGLLMELATLAEERLGTAQRALWAWEQLADLLPDRTTASSHVERLRDKVRVTAGVRELARSDLETATGEQRPRAARKLAAVLREDPAERQRAADLYRESLAAEPDDLAVASALERILWVSGDDDALIALLRSRVAHAGTRTDHVRQLGRLTALEHLRGNHAACVEAAAALLELAPHHEEALTRLERCAERSGGADARVDALTRRARDADAPGARARALTRLARLADAAGRSAEAEQHAEQALAIEPEDAEAAILRARNIGSVDASKAAAVLVALRRCTGDSPSLCAALADAAHAAGDRKLEDDALHAWVRLWPADPDPAWRRVALAIDGGDSATLRTSLEHALGCYRAEPEVLLSALDAIAELSGPTVACGLALHATDRVGHAVPRVVEVASALSERSRDPIHRVAALERAVAHAEKPDRVEPLRALARLHAQTGDRGAESRALLRILEVEARDPDALARLAEIYAEGGDHDRLRAVMALRLESARDEDERRERMRDLAAAVLRAGDDPDRADEALAELLAEAGDDPDALGAAAGALAAAGRVGQAVEVLCDAGDAREGADAGGLFERAVALAERQGDAPLALEAAVRGLGHVPGHAPLLLLFERLALDLGDVATGKRTYAELADRAMGRHGRRGLRYRAARWLERAGDPVAALEAYQEAFELGPSLGVIFTSIERLAEELQTFEPLAHACLTMAERMPHAERRLELLLRGAEILRGPLDRPEKAFDVLDEAWRQLGGTVLYDRLRELVPVLAERDRAAGQQAVERLDARLRERADKSWDDEDRIETLMQAARLWVEAAADVDRAAALVDQTLGAADVPPETHADDLCMLAEWLRDADRVDEARARVDAALERVPLHQRATELEASLGVAPGAEATAEPQAQPEAEAAEPGDDGEEARLREQTGTGDLGAAEGLARLLAAQPPRRREAMDLLLWLLRRDPSRVSALRLMHDIASALGAGALADVSAEVLSLFDPDLAAPAPEALLACASFLDASTGVHHEARAIASLTLLRHVWEGANPLYRKSLSDYGVVESDRVPPFASTALGRAWVDAQRILRVDGVELYRRRTGGRELFPLASHPPSVLAGSAAEDEDEVSLRFRIGRALELTRPEHVLLGTLPETEGALLLEAVGAAFGPPQLASRASREAVTVAANLWNTIPARLQQQIRGLLEEDPTLCSYEDLRALTSSAAARAGAMVAGQVRVAAEALLLDDPALAGSSLDSEAAYQAACRASPPLVGLLQFALSDTYLAARARATGR